MQDDEGEEDEGGEEGDGFGMYKAPEIADNDAYIDKYINYVVLMMQEELWMKYTVVKQAMGHNDKPIGTIGTIGTIDTIDKHNNNPKPELSNL